MIGHLTLLVSLAVCLMGCSRDEPKPAPVMVDAVVRTIPELPPLWARLFEQGHKTSWWTWEAIKSHKVDEHGRVTATSTQSTSRESINCEVEKVELLPEARLRSKVVCQEFHRGYDLDPRPDGIWETDGRRLWQVEGGLVGLSLEATANGVAGAEAAAMWDQESDAWCVSATSAEPDPWRACFRAQHGPHRFGRSGRRDGKEVDIYMVIKSD